MHESDSTCNLPYPTPPLSTDTIFLINIILK